MSETNVEKEGRFLPFLKGLVQVIIYPKQGWMDAQYDDYNPKKLFTAGLLPFLAIVSLTSLLSSFYRMSVSFTDSIFSALSTFAGYFIGTYLSLFLLQWIFDTWIRPRNDNEHVLFTYIIYCIGAMAFITLLQNLFPVDLALLSLLPVYVCYIMWSAVPYLDISYEKRGLFLLWSIICLLLPPYILSYIFDSIIS